MPAAHIVHLDGSYGGTGAAPNIAKKNIAMPIEYAINRVHQFLVDEGIRDQITVIASGGIRTPGRHGQGNCTGADGVVIGTAELVAVGCIRCGCCESGRGCARGIATTDDELLEMVTVEWCTQRLVNLYNAWREMLVDILYRLGLDSVAALRGRTDLLRHLDYENEHDETMSHLTKCNAYASLNCTDTKTWPSITQNERKKSCDPGPISGPRRVVPQIARGRRRLRRDRFRLHDSRGRQAYLRALDPDAQPRQRQGGRNRRLRPGAGGHGRVAQGPGRRLHPPGGAVGSNGPRRGRKDMHRAYFDIDQGGMIPTVDDYRDVPLLEVRPPDVARYFVRVKPRSAGEFRRGKRFDRPFRAGRGRRVRLPELAPAEHAILRLAGRQAGVCACRTRGT